MSPGDMEILRNSIRAAEEPLEREVADLKAKLAEAERWKEYPGGFVQVPVDMIQIYRQQVWDAREKLARLTEIADEYRRIVDTAKYRAGSLAIYPCEFRAVLDKHDAFRATEDKGA